MLDVHKLVDYLWTTCGMNIDPSVVADFWRRKRLEGEPWALPPSNTFQFPCMEMAPGSTPTYQLRWWASLLVSHSGAPTATDLLGGVLRASRRIGCIRLRCTRLWRGWCMVSTCCSMVGARRKTGCWPMATNSALPSFEEIGPGGS